MSTNIKTHEEKEWKNTHISSIPKTRLNFLWNKMLNNHFLVNFLCPEKSPNIFIPTFQIF